MTTLLLTSW